MIDLTPLEVRQKKGDFRRALRGYDPELVNDFLDLVADRMEELVKENLSLRDAVESVREEVSAYRHKEQALSQALMTAQKLGEDSRDHAEREAGLILREARLQADATRDEAARQMVREEEALRHVRARRSQLVASFRRLLERELSELEVIQESLDLDVPGSETEGDAVAEQARAPITEEAPDDEGDAYGAVELPPLGGPEDDVDEPAPPEEESDQDRDDWLSALIEEEGEESSRP